MKRAPALAVLALALTTALAAGCDEPECPEESLVLQETGTCSSGPVMLTLTATGCHLATSMTSGATGLPARGAKDASRSPLRQGGFLLYDGTCAGTSNVSCPDGQTFRLCRATRVDYRLELTCVDATGAPVCEATLTEP